MFDDLAVFVEAEDVYPGPIAFTRPFLPAVQDDVLPFRNDPWFDLQEAYISARVPIGEGPVIKVGKFVTLLGSEVIESPSNLNYSRGYLFTLAIPLTHTGVLASYSFTDWLSVQGGIVLVVLWLILFWMYRRKILRLSP